MNELERLQTKYAHQIEDGRRIEAFTTLGEWNWYVTHVIKPTIDEYTTRIMSGQVASDKEDWILRGMVMGMKLIIETPESLKHNAQEAKKKLKAQKEYETDEQ